MKYKLNTTEAEQKRSLWVALRAMLPLMQGEGKNLSIVGLAILLNTGSALLAPVLIAHTIDTYISHKTFSGVLLFSAYLAAVYVMGVSASYVQTIVMGGVARRILFNLRNALFTKLQELPVAFFNQNKAGDLISRINNDTDKLNQFFAQALMQFLGSFFQILGAGVLLIVLEPKLGAGALAPAGMVLILTQVLSAWVKRKNTTSLQSLGSMSSEIQESLTNFKVVVAFNRLDYFREKFTEANTKNYHASIGAGIANNIFTPLYSLASSMAQLIVVVYGIHLVGSGVLTVGLLIGYLLYVNNFYNPLRQLASVWSTLQQALAAFDRISDVLKQVTNLPHIESEQTSATSLIAFEDVSFGYPEGKQVFSHVSFALESGKTYAFVGPTGGGKTTTASLMARLYDPSEGVVLLHGRDIRAFTPEERAATIGFILQEPYLFTGTVHENIVYGNTAYLHASSEVLEKKLRDAGLDSLLLRFEKGLDTPITASGDTVSLGQKQLIAFIRAVLREPKLLILDEATANIDTVTEQLLSEILLRLPKDTTKVIIAHRLNTIEHADEIYFVNAGAVVKAGSMEKAVSMLLSDKRDS